MAKKDPTTATELEQLSVTQLERLAQKRGVTVLRGDGEDGNPLKEDYITSLAAPSGGTTAARRQGRPAHPFTDAQGNPVNDEGQRINAAGDVLETE